MDINSAFCRKYSLKAVLVKGFGSEIQYLWKDSRSQGYAYERKDWSAVEVEEWKSIGREEIMRVTLWGKRCVTQQRLPLQHSQPFTSEVAIVHYLI